MGQNGGKRPGAGRKAGSINKKTIAKAEEIESSGLTPIEFWTQGLRDEAADWSKKNICATNLAPYVHSKMPTRVAMGGDPDAPPIGTEDKTDLKGITLEQLKRAKLLARELIEGDS